MSKLQNDLDNRDSVEKTHFFNRYIREEAHKKGIPIIGSFELTPRCTLDCKMCYVHLAPHQMRQEELSTIQWLNLIDEACDAGMLYANLTGGECLLYPGFWDIFNHLREKGVLVSILTNGTLLDEKTVNRFIEQPPQRIQISVYGSSPEKYEKVTGNSDAFYKVDKALDMIKKAGIPFNLAITVSKQMVDDFEKILLYCKSKEPQEINVNTSLFSAREETGREYGDFAPTLDEQVEIFKTRMKIEGKSVVPYSCEEELLDNVDTCCEEKQYIKNGVACTAGRIKFSICWDGKMVPCNAFGFAEAFPLKDGFLKAWKHINTKACQYKNPDQCSDCIYRKACEDCPAIHWSFSGEGEVYPPVCYQTKRLVLEGIRIL